MKDEGEEGERKTSWNRRNEQRRGIHNDGHAGNKGRMINLEEGRQTREQKEESNC